MIHFIEMNHFNWNTVFRSREVSHSKYVLTIFTILRSAGLPSVSIHWILLKNMSISNKKWWIVINEKKKLLEENDFFKINFQPLLKGYQVLWPYYLNHFTFEKLKILKSSIKFNFHLHFYLGLPLTFRLFQMIRNEIKREKNSI